MNFMITSIQYFYCTKTKQVVFDKNLPNAF